MDYEKSRTLALYKILLEYTDEEHQLSMREIKDLMEMNGYKCSEDSIFRYIKQLRYELGVDIVSTRGRSASYFIGNRILDKEEIQLLIDALNASTVIGDNISRKIIKKLKGLVSSYQSEELPRTVLTTKFESRVNKRILYNINEIQNALNNNAQIEFDYMDWSVEGKLEKTGEKRHLNPWGLIWANERYYLYGYTVTESGTDVEERTYRVDKIGAINVLNNTIRQGKENFKHFDVGRYVSRRINMFSGEERMVKVLVPKALLGSFIDRFGKDVEIICKNEDIVQIKFIVAITNIFFGWLVGLEGVVLIEPLDVREKMKEYLNRIIDNYD